MSVTTDNITNIIEYVEKHYPKTEEVKAFGDFSFTVKKDLPIIEKQAFVEQVVSGAFIDDMIPSKVLLDALFNIALLQYCTDIELPTIYNSENEEHVINSELANQIAIELGIDIYLEKLVKELRECVNDRMEFEKAKLIAYAGMSTANTESIEMFNVAMSKGIDLLDKVIEQIDKNGNKLFKNLTPKKIDGFLNGIQKKVVDSTTKAVLEFPEKK